VTPRDEARVNAMSGIPDPPLPYTGGRIATSEDERLSVERRVLQQYIVAPALSFAALLVGFNLGWPRLAAVGVIGFGLTALLIGYRALSERRLMFIRGALRTAREYRYFIYEGVAAVPYGLAYVTGAVCLIAPAALFFNGTSLERMRDAVLTRPSLALVPLGTLLLFHGLGFLIGFGRRAASIGDRLWIELLHLPERLAGLILIAWATTLLAIGLIEWLRPELFHQWFQSIFGNPWPFKGG
jgi:hypothetical protein